MEIASHESIAFRLSVLLSTLDVGLPKILVCVKVEALCSRDLWCILFILLTKTYLLSASKVKCVS